MRSYRRKKNATREKELKMQQPLERGKLLLRKCPIAIRDLHLATNDLKQPAIKKCVPPRLWNEYQHAFAGHSEVLGRTRDTLESVMCNDEKLFLKKIGDTLDVGEKELEDTGRTLKAWKNSLHVYGGTKFSAVAKKAAKDKTTHKGESSSSNKKEEKHKKTRKGESSSSNKKGKS